MGLLFAALTLTGCSKSDEAAPLSGAWKVLCIQPAGERAQWTLKDYTLRLRVDGVYYLNLDVNTCGGPYLSAGAGGIDFLGVGCTRLCCDSGFAQQMVSILDNVSVYHIEGRKLTLIGERGLIEVHSVKD